MPRRGRCHWNEPRNVSKHMRQSRPQRRGDAEALGSRLRVSASQQENLLQPVPRSGRCHWNEPRNVSKHMRQSRPQRRGDAEALGSRLRVSASQQENLLQPVPRSGRCHWNEPRNVSKHMRQSRPQRRGDAEVLVHVSASLRLSGGFSSSRLILKTAVVGRVPSPTGNVAEPSRLWLDRVQRQDATATLPPGTQRSGILAAA